MLRPLPVRFSDDRRVATWNPAMTFSPHVLLRVLLPSGALEERRSLNSGRARVREGESIDCVLAEDLLHP